MAQVTVKTVVLGCVSSGKSAFLNALIGDELLPGGENIETGSITYVKHVPNLEGQYDCEQETEKITFHTLADAKSWIYDKNRISGTPELHVSTSFRLLKNADGLKEVGLEVIDIPGLNESPNHGADDPSAVKNNIVEARRITERILKEVDLVVLVVLYNQLRTEEVDRLAGMIRTHCRSHVPLFVAVSQLDRVKLLQDRSQIQTEAQRLFQNNVEFFGQRPVEVMCTRFLYPPCNYTNCRVKKFSCKHMTGLQQLAEDEKHDLFREWMNLLTTWTVVPEPPVDIHNQMEQHVRETSGVAPLIEKIQNLLFLSAATRGLDILSQPLEMEKRAYYSSSMTQLKDFSDKNGCANILELLFKLLEVRVKFNACVNLLNQRDRSFRFCWPMPWSRQSVSSEFEKTRQRSERKWREMFKEIILAHGGEPEPGQHLEDLYDSTVSSVLETILHPQVHVELQKITPGTRLVTYGPNGEVVTLGKDAASWEKFNGVGNTLFSLCQTFRREQDAEKILADETLTQIKTNAVKARVQKTFATQMQQFLSDHSSSFEGVNLSFEDCGLESSVGLVALVGGLLGAAVGGLAFGGLAVVGGVTFAAIEVSAGVGAAGTLFGGASFFFSKSDEELLRKTVEERISDFNKAVRLLQEIKDLKPEKVEEIMKCAESICSHQEKFTFKVGAPGGRKGGK